MSWLHRNEEIFEKELESEKRRKELEQTIQSLRKEIRDLKKAIIKLKRRKAERVQDMYSDSLFDEFPEVTAVDVGYRQTGQGKVLNEEDDEFHLLVWVKKKLSEEELEQRQLKILPKEFKITDCVTVDVIEGEVTYAMENPGKTLDDNVSATVFT